MTDARVDAVAQAIYEDRYKPEKNPQWVPWSDLKHLAIETEDGGNGIYLTMMSHAVAALRAADAAAWQPTHQHRKGGLYRVITRGEIEADLTPCVVYDDAAGRVWARPAAEFDDGRFTPLPPAPEDSA